MEGKGNLAQNPLSVHFRMLAMQANSSKICKTIRQMTDPQYVLFLVKVHMQLLLVYKHSIQLIKINIHCFVT